MRSVRAEEPQNRGQADHGGVTSGEAMKSGQFRCLALIVAGAMVGSTGSGIGWWEIII